MTTRSTSVTQCQKPSGWIGRFILWQMNASHSKLTDWGLAHVLIEKHYTVLDVGCGGGRTVSKLAVMAGEGKVFGIDLSDESVAASKRSNVLFIGEGRVAIRSGSVSQLPFPDDMFDLVTAVETHFWWPNLTADMSEVFRVLKHGGMLMVVAEVYKGASTKVSKLAERMAAKTGMKLLTVDEHGDLFAKAGYSDVRVFEERARGWSSAL